MCANYILQPEYLAAGVTKKKPFNVLMYEQNMINSAGSKGLAVRSQGTKLLQACTNCFFLNLIKENYDPMFLSEFHNLR